MYSAIFYRITRKMSFWRGLGARRCAADWVKSADERRLFFVQASHPGRRKLHSY